MAKIKIEKEKCKGCFLCVAVCPKELILVSRRLSTRGVNYVECIDEEKCIGCGQCAIICPDCCIEVYR